MQHYGWYLEGQGYCMTLQQNHVRPITSLFEIGFYNCFWQTTSLCPIPLRVALPGSTSSCLVYVYSTEELPTHHIHIVTSWVPTTFALHRTTTLSKSQETLPNLPTNLQSMHWPGYMYLILAMITTNGHTFFVLTICYAHVIRRMVEGH